MTALANNLGEILLAHRLGIVDAAETQELLAVFVDADELHNQVEAIRAARRKDDRNRTAATLKYALIG